MSVPEDGEGGVSLSDILRELRWIEVDFDELDRDRGRWFYRPFTPEELTEHPDRGRIEATIEAAAEVAVRQACEIVEAHFDDGEESP